MTRPDPFELLRRINPISREQLRDEDEAQLEAILAGRVTELRDRRRPRQIAAAAVVVSAVLATAAWVVIRRDPAENPLQVVCHREASLDSDRTPVVSGGDPVAECAAVWASGEFGPGDVPQLTACAGPDDYASVFPGGIDVCARLGLAALASFEEDIGPLQQLQAELSNAFGPDCVERDEAVALVEATLDRLGLTDWRVDESTPARADRPCATWSADPARKAVVLGGRRAGVPVPPAPATTSP